MDSENEVLPVAQEPSQDNSSTSESHSNQSSENTLVPKNPCDNDDAPIHKLDDTCLQKIFSFLPFIEREKNTIVCKRWKTLIRKMWLLELEFDTIKGTPFEIPRKYRNQDYSRNLNFLKKKILKRCGLKKILLQANKFTCYHGVIADIVNRCPNIEELTIYKLSMCRYKLNLVAFLENLKKLVLHDCDPVHDSNLSFALRDNHTLTHLEVTNCKKLQGRFLRHLKAPLETLVICCQEIFNTYYLEKNEKLRSTLKHLNLSSIEYFYQADLGDLVDNFPNLHSLTIAKYDLDPIDDYYMDVIPDLKHLLSLNVSFNMNVDTEFLKDIVEKCPQLESLDISGTDIDAKIIKENSSINISALSALQNLRSLNLSYLKEIDCNEITKYATKSPPVEHLYLAGVPNLKDEHVKSLLMLCPRLKHLDLSRCPEITDETLKTANQVLESRVSKLRLELIVGGTSIQKPSEKNEESNSKIVNHPLLSVSYNDNYELLKSRYIYGSKNFLVSKEDDYEEQRRKEATKRVNRLFNRSEELTESGCSDSDNDNAQNGAAKRSRKDNNEDDDGDETDNHNGTNEDSIKDMDTGTPVVADFCRPS